MPRPNPGRILESEASLARRIQHERTARDWTYERLAQRMTDAGCPINTSGVYKIEKGEPRRRITVDELVALSHVFGISVPELLRPPEEALGRELVKRLERLGHAAKATLEANQQHKDALRDLGDFIVEHPEAVEQMGAAGVSIPELVEMLRDIDEEEDARYADRLRRIEEAGANG